MAIRITPPQRRGKRLAIIVPYRNREDHLKAFTGHIASYFNRDKQDRVIPYSVHIIEQAGDAPFNRAMLCNCGFFLSYNLADYVCFHDVDYLPVWADYSYSDVPAHLIWHGLPTAYQYDDFIGAVTMFPKAAFEEVNGFSNEYWGWGEEDEELRERCRIKKLTIKRRQGTYIPLPHQHNGLDAQGYRLPVAQKNQQRYQQRFPDIGHLMKKDGLTNLRYTLLETSTMKLNGQEQPNFFFHRVQLAS